MMICGYQNERAINVIRDNFPGVTKPIRLQNKGNRLIKELCNTPFHKNRTFTISSRINQRYIVRLSLFQNMQNFVQIIQLSYQLEHDIVYNAAFKLSYTENEM